MNPYHSFYHTCEHSLSLNVDFSESEAIAYNFNKNCVSGSRCFQNSNQLLLVRMPISPAKYFMKINPQLLKQSCRLT